MINRVYYILLFSFLLAGTDGTIRGKIISSTDGQPLIGVQVYIEEEEIGAISDIDGNFLILNVPVGEHNLTVELLGYKTVKSRVNVSMDRTTWYNTGLEVSALELSLIHI